MINKITHHLKHVGHLLQPSLEIFTGLHEIFDIVDVGKVDLERLEELGFALRQLGVGEDAEQVAEVVSAVEGDPLHVVKKNNACHTRDNVTRGTTQKFPCW
jgi:hypothetical protein